MGGMNYGIDEERRTQSCERRGQMRLLVVCNIDDKDHVVVTVCVRHPQH